MFDHYLQVIESFEERQRALEEKLKTLSEKEPYREPVGWLRCYRGIDTVTARPLLPSCTASSGSRRRAR